MDNIIIEVVKYAYLIGVLAVIGLVATYKITGENDE